MDNLKKYFLVFIIIGNSPMLFSQGYEEIDKQFRLKYENLSILNPDELLIIAHMKIMLIRLKMLLVDFLVKLIIL